MHSVLTIVGYSINDTIVIFDRIRENLALKTGKQTAEELREVANKSLTQTLSRSIQYFYYNFYYGRNALHFRCGKYP